jgi:hypothetical protein
MESANIFREGGAENSNASSGSAEARGFDHKLGVVRPSFSDADMAARLAVGCGFMCAPPAYIHAVISALSKLCRAVHR